MQYIRRTASEPGCSLEAAPGRLDRIHVKPIGRYEVERLVGAGGMGVVFKAYDTELNRPVAIKVLAPFLAHSGAARKRFAREARAAAAVVHEHVVAIHNVETEGESPFLVMQFVAGESLQQRLDREGPLEVCEILRIGLQTASGLAAAHAQGLVHRDVKPSNILLEMGVERALLTDFGLARATDDASLTHTGFHPGTPQYMSPEQARGDVVDERSDLFSLGSVMYAMCTGHSPFRAETGYGILRRITDHEPRMIRQSNPQIPLWLEQIIARLLAKPTADRFQSAAEVADLLRRCLAHIQQPTSVKLPAELQRSANRNWLAGHKRWIAAILTIAACAAVGFAIAAKWSPQPRPAISKVTQDGPILSGTPNSTSPGEKNSNSPGVIDDGLSVAWDAADSDLRAYEQTLHTFEQESQQLWETSPGRQPP